LKGGNARRVYLEIEAELARLEDDFARRIPWIEKLSLGFPAFGEPCYATKTWLPNPSASSYTATRLKEMAFLLITALVADDAYSFPGTGKVWACE